MLLNAMSYREFAGHPREWILEKTDFELINLFVGRNASGKSRTQNVISSLARQISGRSSLVQSGQYEMHFSLKDENWKYLFHYENQKVVSETLLRGDTTLLDRREGGFGTIYSEQEGKSTQFQTPDTNVAAFARQDSIQHSFLEPLMDWANGVFHYQFGSEMGHRLLIALNPSAPPPDPRDPNQTVGVFRLGEKEYGDSFKEEILKDMKAIGYDVTEVGCKSPQSITINFVPAIVSPSSVVSLFVQEAPLKGPTEQFDMSQGMFRALATLIHLNYGILAGKSHTVLIDDIGEGLDFDRSSALIKLLIDKSKAANVQLIMSTNDRFVMNAVPIDYWTVLDRRGNVVHAYNKRNSFDKFESFKFTGLSNFDFFATDYLTSEETKP
jgi:energy-coupling factor transporter ATP-binding protein EcfA2